MIQLPPNIPPSVDDHSTPLEHSLESPLLEIGNENSHKEGNTEVQPLDTGTKPKERHVKGATFEIPTLQPFVKHQRPRKTKFRPDPTLIHFDHLFGSESWA